MADSKSSENKQIRELYELGKNAYHQGNYEEAFKYHHQAASLGSNPNAYFVGLYFYGGKGVAKDEAQGEKWMLRSAQSGFSHAQYELARRVKPFNVNNEWFQRALEQKNEGAEYHYANILMKQGRETEALTLLHKLAQPGTWSSYAYAQYKLGKYYTRKKQHKASFIWYSKAVENGHTKAIKRLALMYKRGIGCEKDLEQFRVWNAKLPIEERFPE